jgi:hypothetical protein
LVSESFTTAPGIVSILVSGVPVNDGISDDMIEKLSKPAKKTFDAGSHNVSAR